MSFLTNGYNCFKLLHAFHFTEIRKVHVKLDISQNKWKKDYLL